MLESDMNPYILDAIKRALLDPIGEGQGFTGLADFSPDRADESVLARSVYRQLLLGGWLDTRPKRSTGIA